jgi:RHS repeat-associated protein
MPWSSAEVFSLAAGSQVNDRKPHQGVTGKNPGLHQGLLVSNSTTALGVSWRLWSGTVPGATVSYEYDAFGNSVSTSGSTPNNYLYRGEQFDPDLGLYYLRARYYNPLTGRFMSRDPEQGNPYDPKSLHKYLYAGGDPVNAIDPTGRADLLEVVVAVYTVVDIAYTVHKFGQCVGNLFNSIDYNLREITQRDINWHDFTDSLPSDALKCTFHILWEATWPWPWPTPMTE